MEVDIDNKIYNEALLYAQYRGMSISNEIEKFLIYFIKTNKREKGIDEEKNIPEPVLELLGAASPRVDYDLNARDAYHSHIKEKYK